jgi:hypothetical protein
VTNLDLNDSAHESTFPAVALMLLLFCADAAFILLHLINVETDWLRGNRMSLEDDGGPAELFQYLKEFWIVVCMVVAFVSTRHVVYLSWAFVFVFLLADDAGRIHEGVGGWLAERYALPAPFGLRPKDIGELLFAGSIGLAALAVVGVAVRLGTEQCRRISRDLGLLVVALAVVGVFVDMLHTIAYQEQSLLAQVLLVVEDGGEMIVMSGLTAYAFHVAAHVGRTHLDLWSVMRTQLAWNANSRA